MVIGAFLTCSTVVILGWVMPGYRPLHDYVSELALGPRGWIQRINFVFTGTVHVIFGLGMSQALGRGLAVRAGAALLGLIGLGMIGCGATPVERRPFSVMSRGGQLHLLFAVIFVFALMPLVCLAFARAFTSHPGWSGLVPYTLGTAVMNVVFFMMGISPGLASRLPGSRWPLIASRYAGLIQRMYFGSFLIWEVVVSFTAARFLF